MGFGMAVFGEGYRSDAASVIGFAAAKTERIELLSGVMQIPARPPGLAALTAATLNALSGGRFRMGLGVSNPDISEGWYGVPFDKPLARTREYVQIVRRALDGQSVRYDGQHYKLPAGDRDGAPLHITTEPLRTDIPVYLAAVGDRNLRLAGEIADGWIGAFATPESVVAARGQIESGAREGRRSLADFDLMPSLPTVFTADVQAGIDQLRPHYAHFLGLGDPRRNLYVRLAERMGFAAEMDAFAKLMAEGDAKSAAAAVPGELIDRTALVGPVERAADRMREYDAAGATTLTIMLSPARTHYAGRLALLRGAARALELSGTG
jgi:F420-dependent oxidoreductase-like protein